MNWPNQIRKTREALGLSQQDFADLIGCKYGRMVRRWEAGRTPGSTWRVELLAAFKLAEGALSHAASPNHAPS